MEQIIAIHAILTLTIVSLGLIAVILGLREFVHLLAGSNSQTQPIASPGTKQTPCNETCTKETEFAAAG